MVSFWYFEKLNCLFKFSVNDICNDKYIRYMFMVGLFGLNNVILNKV